MRRSASPLTGRDARQSLPIYAAGGRFSIGGAPIATLLDRRKNRRKLPQIADGCRDSQPQDETPAAIQHTRRFAALPGENGQATPGGEKARILVATLPRSE